MLLAIIAFCVALGLPLAAAFDTEKYLSDALLHSLPRDVAKPARILKDLLNSNPLLHFDEPQEWGPEEVRLFRSVYFPALQEFVTAAAQYPQLVKESGVGIHGRRVVQLLGLGRALEHLLDIRYDHGQLIESHLKVAAPGAIPGTIVSLNIARANFVTLRALVARWLLQGLPDPDANVSEGDRSLQAAIIGPMVKLICLSNVKGDWGMMSSKKSVTCSAETRPDIMSVAECPLVEQELQALIGELKDAIQQQQDIFDKLQSAVNNFLKSGCSQLLLIEPVKRWKDSVGQRPLEFPSALPPPGDVRFKMISLQREVITLVNRQLAQLVGETVLVQLQLVKSIGPNCVSRAIYPTIPELVRGEKPKLERIAEDIGQFVTANKDSSAEDLIERLADSLAFNWELPVQNKGAIELLQKVMNMDSENEGIMRLEEETLEALKDIYDPIKRIVQAYAAILELGIAKALEQSQMDRLLITAFKFPPVRETLSLYKSIMERIEAALSARGVDLEAYNWNYFPLRFILHPPGSKSAASGAVSGEGKRGTGKLLGNKRTLEGNDEPEAKKAKNEESEDADANAPPS